MSSPACSSAVNASQALAPSPTPHRKRRIPAHQRLDLLPVRPSPRRDDLVLLNVALNVAPCHYLPLNPRPPPGPHAVCLEMPHVLHMIIGCFTAVVFIAITAFMVVASCDLNPISKRHLASPAAYTRLKVLMAKAVYVIAVDCLDQVMKVEVTLGAFCVAIIVWWNFRAVSRDSCAMWVMGHGTGMATCKRVVEGTGSSCSAAWKLSRCMAVVVMMRSD